MFRIAQVWADGFVQHAAIVTREEAAAHLAWIAEFGILFAKVPVRYVRAPDGRFCSAKALGA